MTGPARISRDVLARYAADAAQDVEGVRRLVPDRLRRHGGVRVTVSVDGARVTIEPVTADAAAIVLGETVKDLGAAVAVRLVRALGGDVALDGERLTVTLPS